MHPPSLPPLLPPSPCIGLGRTRGRPPCRGTVGEGGGRGDACVGLGVKVGVRVSPAAVAACAAAGAAPAPHPTTTPLLTWRVEQRLPCSLPHLQLHPGKLRRAGWVGVGHRGGGEGGAASTRERSERASGCSGRGTRAPHTALPPHTGWSTWRRHRRSTFRKSWRRLRGWEVVAAAWSRQVSALVGWLAAWRHAAPAHQRSRSRAGCRRPRSCTACTEARAAAAGKQEQRGRAL